MTALYIEREDQLALVYDALVDSDVLFLDTEFESRASGTTLCVLQVTDRDSTFLIDAITVPDLSSLGQAIGRREQTWVVHAGRQDVELLMDALNLSQRPEIFDTQIGWSLVSAEYQVSLAYLEAVICGLRVSKGRQTSNWKKRPLTDAQIEYAIGDVLYLPKIYDTINARLIERGRPDSVYSASKEIFEPPKKETTSVSLSSYRNLWQLDAAQKAALEVLVNHYNDSKSARGGPHYKTLFSIAARLPQNADELSEIKGVHRRWASQAERRLLPDMLEAAEDAENQDTQNQAPPTPYGSFDDHCREAWLQCARADICADTHIAPELAFPGWLMKRLKASIHHVSDPKRLSEEFVGWRSCLIEPWERFCDDTYPQ